MNYLKGVVVRLKTGRDLHAGTDDALYLGVSGVAGGREFPLDVAWFDDAKRVSDVKYAFGEVWDEKALLRTRRPRHADRDWNDPKLFYIGFDAIDRVYLRKQAGRRDDAYELDAIEVTLFGDEPTRRRFASETAIWLGVEYGLQVWIPEREPDRG